MSITVRSVPSGGYTTKTSPWYGDLYRVMSELIYEGNLKSRFDAFESEAAEMGAGLEVSIILAAKGQDYSKTSTGSNKYEEHAFYKPKVINIVSTERKPKQYAVTVSDEEIALASTSRDKMIRKAEAYVNTLYQGWINDKNSSIADAIAQIAANASWTQNITIGADPKAYALELLSTLQGAVDELREGVTGTTYGNTEVGEDRIAAERIVVLVNPNTKALLNVYGLADAFNRSDREVDVIWLTSNRIAENTAIVTDARNIVLKRRWEQLVDIKNSDGSMNYFYNVDYFIDVLVTDTTTNRPALPVKVIKGTEAT